MSRPGASLGHSLAEMHVRIAAVQLPAVAYFGVRPTGAMARRTSLDRFVALISASSAGWSARLFLEFGCDGVREGAHLGGNEPYARIDRKHGALQRLVTLKDRH